ncbi:MAG: glycosyltransferase family 2 protein [Candidatus Abyssobacteria bacterium SURF_17]|uniref:Glycosyltransferase family 2 protein n=1 Tax=Candidatus Abyssobacteria bacterium SURF_17 TaxID=2093361 RepID=A0A419EW43_9BACT|nr:MAG: glycosyltransferase family 2 protein [Candidatus Abyssubacteria bacterium SURF_17]
MPEQASVIICTYNRHHLLERALRALERQSVGLESFEVIVVDDASTDETPRVCSMMSRELPNMRYYVTDKNLGVGEAGNVALRHARGEYLLFTDDDCVAREDWVDHMSAALANEHIVAGAIESPTSSFIRLCHNIDQFHLYMLGRKNGYIRFIAGANMGLRRSLVEKIGSFEQGRRIGPDTEFGLRACENGYRIFFEPKAVVVHDPERSDFTTILKHSADHASETIFLRNRYRLFLHTPFVLRSPLLTLLAAPLIALWVTLGIYGRNPKLARMFWTAPVVYALKLAWCWGAARGLYKERRAVG